MRIITVVDDEEAWRRYNRQRLPLALPINKINFKLFGFGSVYSSTFGYLRDNQLSDYALKCLFKIHELGKRIVFVNKNDCKSPAHDTSNLLLLHALLMQLTYNCSGFSLSCFKYLDFSAKANDKSVDLSWTITNETGTRSFFVERNAGNGFQSIGTVASLSTNGEHHYNFNDFTAAAGNNLYRLKMIDFDGTFTYSKTISIHPNQKNNNVFIYPNPGITTKTVMINSSTSGNYVIRITDNAGRQVKQLNGQLQTGNNKLLIDVSGWAGGVYFIHLETGSDANTHHLKFIKE